MNHSIDMDKRLTTIVAFLAVSCAAIAQNPVIRDQYTADPTAKVFDGKVWLYPSHDIISPVEPERKWFCMEDYHVFSSENLIDWTDHGVIVDQKDVPWGNPQGYSMWAPDCIERGGKYYFVFPNAPVEGRGFANGVAVADRPEGPFKVADKPIAGVMGIDPCILQASDGNMYIIWSGMGLRGAKLKEDFSGIEGESVLLDKTFPKGFREGPFAFEKDGRFYLTFPWVEDRTETLAYAMSDNPLGPYEFKGLIMEQSANECWTNHHSIVEYKGEWYLFYHHNDYSPTFDKNRSVRIDRIKFNHDGTIRQVTPTLRGVGVTPAVSHVEVDRYSAIYHVATGIDFLDPANPFRGWFVTLGRPETWVRYDDVDFGSGVSGVMVRARSAKGSTIVLKAGENVLVTMGIPESADWMEVSATVDGKAEGIQDLRVENIAGDVELDWVSFK